MPAQARPEWRFRPMQPGEINIDPVEAEFFTTDALKSAVDALVRETVQNSLDAGRAQGPVHVRLRLPGPSERLAPSVAEPYFAGQRYCPYGYFGRFEQDFALPIEAGEALDAFRQDFHCARTDEPGLSVVVPCPDADMAADELVSQSPNEARGSGFSRECWTLEPVQIADARGREFIRSSTCSADAKHIRD